MDILYENSYERTPQLIKELCQYNYFRRPFVVIMYIFLFFFFFSNLISLFKGEEYYTAVLIAVPAFAILQVILYRRRLKAMIAREQQSPDGQPLRVSTVVTSDGIQGTASNGVVNEIKFSQIKNAFQTTGLIVLRSRDGLTYIFDKMRFSVGTAEDFMLFLIQKGIRIK